MQHRAECQTVHTQLTKTPGAGHQKVHIEPTCGSGGEQRSSSSSSLGRALSWPKVQRTRAHEPLVPVVQPLCMFGSRCETSALRNCPRSLSSSSPAPAPDRLGRSTRQARRPPRRTASARVAQQNGYSSRVFFVFLSREVLPCFERAFGRACSQSIMVYARATREGGEDGAIASEHRPAKAASW